MDIVYVLINAGMPSLVKIGYTSDLKKRLRDLYKTNVPFMFECFFACKVEDAPSVERHLHHAFGEQRVNPHREFFKIDPHRVVSALKLAMKEDVTPSPKIDLENKEDAAAATAAIERENKRRSAFDFDACGIKIGEELSFERDENIKVTVVSNKAIEHEEEVTSLSALATKLLKSKYTVQGPRYWLYKGETLLEIRDRIESERDGNSS